MDQEKLTTITEMTSSGKRFLANTFKCYAKDLPEWEYDQLMKTVKDIIRSERIDAAARAIESFPNICI